MAEDDNQDSQEVAHDLPSWAPGFASYYEALTGDFRGDVPMYLEMAKRYGSPILELACGTGRVAIPLAEAGYEVVAMDFDKDMLSVGQSKAKMLDLTRRLQFSKADMKTFSLRKKFPLIIAGANSLIHLPKSSDLKKALSRCKSHLEPDGSLFIAFEPTQYISAAGKYRVERERPRQVFNRELGETLLYRGTTTIDPNFQRILRHHEFANPRAPHDASRTAVFDYATRPIFPGELEVLIDSVGLKIMDIAGDYELRPMTRQSEKLIYRVMRKK